MVTLTFIQKKVYEEYIKNKYLDSWTNKKHQKIFDVAEIGLINTEVSEAIEEIRKKNMDLHNLGLECADIIIRTLNFMTRKGLNAEKYINYKNHININRDYLHGKSV